MNRKMEITLKMKTEKGGEKCVCLNRDDWEVATRKPGRARVYVFLGPRPLRSFHKDTEQLQAA